MPPAVFELTISVRERPQTYALDRAAIGNGVRRLVTKIIAVNLQINSSNYTAINSLINAPKTVDNTMTVFCKIFRIPNYVWRVKPDKQFLSGFPDRSDFLLGEGIFMKMTVHVKKL
jgi:hypothetical protein